MPSIVTEAVAALVGSAPAGSSGRLRHAGGGGPAEPAQAPAAAETAPHRAGKYRAAGCLRALARARPTRSPSVSSRSTEASSRGASPRSRRRSSAPWAPSTACASGPTPAPSEPQQICGSLRADRLRLPRCHTVASAPLLPRQSRSPPSRALLVLSDPWEYPPDVAGRPARGRTLAPFEDFVP